MKPSDLLLGTVIGKLALDTGKSIFVILLGGSISGKISGVAEVDLWDEILIRSICSRMLSADSNSGAFSTTSSSRLVETSIALGLFESNSFLILMSNSAS